MITLEDALESLHLLPDWEQRYTFVIDLAKQLPAMPPEEKTAQNLVPGCTSQVWMTRTWQNAKLELHLDSDALIVKGLLTLVYLAYNGKTAEEIAAYNLEEHLHGTQLLNHLSPNRRNGFISVLATLRRLG